MTTSLQRTWCIFDGIYLTKVFALIGHYSLCTTSSDLGFPLPSCGHHWCHLPREGASPKGTDEDDVGNRIRYWLVLVHNALHHVHYHCYSDHGRLHSVVHQLQYLPVVDLLVLHLLGNPRLFHVHCRLLVQDHTICLDWFGPHLCRDLPPSHCRLSNRIVSTCCPFELTPHYGHVLRLTRNWILGRCWSRCDGQHGRQFGSFLWVCLYKRDWEPYI